MSPDKHLISSTHGYHTRPASLFAADMSARRRHFFTPYEPRHALRRRAILPLRLRCDIEAFTVEAMPSEFDARHAASFFFFASHMLMMPAECRVAVSAQRGSAAWSET